MNPSPQRFRPTFSQPSFESPPIDPSNPYRRSDGIMEDAGGERVTTQNPLRRSRYVRRSGSLRHNRRQARTKRSTYAALGLKQARPRNRPQESGNLPLSNWLPAVFQQPDADPDSVSLSPMSLQHSLAPAFFPLYITPCRGPHIFLCPHQRSFQLGCARIGSSSVIAVFYPAT
jgi:hypothetical protein